MGLAAVHFGEVYGYFQRRGIWQNPVGMLPCEDLYSSYVLVLCFNLRNDYYICHGIWKYFICSGSLCILLFCMENQQAAHTGSTRMREEAPRIGSMVIF